MAKIIDEGWLKPDDEIYKTGPVVGGKRFDRSVKNGKYDPKTDKEAKPPNKKAEGK